MCIAAFYVEDNPMNRQILQSLRNCLAVPLSLLAAKNMITGTIPESLRQMNKLMVLQLDRNPMHGTVPEWLPELQSLRALQLSAFAGLQRARACY